MALITCPECSSEISSSAAACPKCGCPVTYDMTIPGQERASGRSFVARQTGETMGTMMLIVPWLAILLIFFWIGGMNLLQGPGSSLSLVTIGTIGITAILAALEASAAGMLRDYDRGTYGPVAWFFIVAMIWLVGYPAYLYKRRAYGLSNHLLIGTITALAFIGSVYLMQKSIDASADGLRQNLDSMQKALGG